MVRTTLGTAVALLVILAAGGPRAEAYEIDYATYDVVVTDTQGIKTEASNFGFWAGPNMLTVRRGDATIDIPFRKIRSITIGEYEAEKGVYPCSVLAKTGKVIECLLERLEGNRIMGGESDIGEFRIRIGLIRKLELVRLTAVD